MSFFEYYYKNIIKYEFLTKYIYRNVYELPKLDKVVLCFTLSQTSLKNILPLVSALMIISCQKPFLLTSKRVYINLRVKSGVPVGCKVDIRGKRKYLFFERLIFSIIPRLKEYSTCFRANTVSISVFNLFVFKEIEKDYDYFPNLPVLNIHLVMKVNNSKEIFDFFTAFRFPLTRMNRSILPQKKIFSS
jgi:large subunit ribosomal protein L5